HIKVNAVKSQEGYDRKKRRALVAVDEGVVARKAKAIRSCERREFGIAVMVSIERTGKRRLKRSGITQTRSAPELRKLLIVNCNDEFGREPDWLRHFASSRRAF